MTNLNPKQREAVTAHMGPVLVLAGAGSGKTTVLIERVAYLIREREIPPWCVLAITFTKKAAEELKNRLERQLGAPALDVWALTFHAACARILRRDIEKLGGYDSRFTVYDSDDSARVMKSCIKELNLDDKQYPPRAMLSAVSRAKNAMIAPDGYEQDFAGAHNAFRVSKEAALYAMYDKKLRSANALDFDDLLLLTVRLFEELPDVLEFYQNRFKALLVDEYQDTNALQYRFCSLLAKKHRNLFAVGDDDQSIYRFRGATIENILNFERQYPECHTVRLEQNYRSTRNILEAANGVIENNQGRKGKTLWTESGAGAPIRVYHARDGGGEGYYIAGLVNAHVRGGGKYRDFAVLYRMNAQAFQIEEALRRAGVPYRIIGGTRFVDRAEIRDALSFLHVLHNPSDNLRLTRIINTPARGISEKTVEAVAALAGEYGVSMWNILENAGTYPAFTKRAAGSLTAFWRMMDELRALTCPMAELYDKLLDATGYLRFYQARRDAESEGRAENVLELRSAIVKYEQESGDPTLTGFLEDMSLASDVENYDPNADAVVLMTMHSAKGLEFPVVFVAGVEEGIFPGSRSVSEPEELEEERRLCYVAITRARRELHLTCADSRLMYGYTTNNRHSRFIDELPQNCVEHILPARERTPANASRPRGQAFPRGAETPRFRPPAAKQAAPAVSFSAGDRVEHKAFGAGLISNVKPAGGDALVGIIFDTVGEKHFMLKSASPYLKKL